MRYDGNAFTLTPETPMTSTPITVTLPAQTMTVEALEALIAEAKAATPKPFVPEVGQRVRLTRDNDFGEPDCGKAGDTGIVLDANRSRYTATREYRVQMDSGIGNMIVRVDGLEPAPTPRFAVGDDAVYRLFAVGSEIEPGKWGVVRIIEVCRNNTFRATSLTTPELGVGMFEDTWLRPATPDESAAATRITSKTKMLLQRKSDGAVFRVWRTGGAYTHCDQLVPSEDYGFSSVNLLTSTITTLNYDVLPNYLIQGA